MSELVEAALRAALATPKTRPALPPLPVFDLGEFPVDIADREALYELLDGERDDELYGIPRGKGRP